MTGDGSGHAAWKPPTPKATAPVSESFEGYRDLQEIGVGGDSVVYRAIEETLGREVAIKVLNVDDESRSARFAREVEITLDLGRQHPNIVTVLATGVTGSGRPAIVMEFYPGGTLHDRLREFGPLPVEEVVRIGLVLADALSFAHDRGVLHRDVKPQNVLVLPTSWVLADFGIARLVDSEHTSSVETFTYRHASPQVLDGQAPTAADDIWSLGSTLYTLVDGRPPFASDDPDHDSALAYLRRARIEPHRPLAAPGAEALASVIDRCLVKEVADRWTSAGELHDALLGLRHRAWEPNTAPRPVATAPVEPLSEPLTESSTGPSLVDDAGHTGRAWAPAISRHRQQPDAPGAPGAPDRTAPRSPAAAEPPVESPAEWPAEAAARDWDRPPAPVALSAAAHVPAVAPADSEPTGMGLPVEHEAPETVEPAVPAAPGPVANRRRRLIIGLGALALLIGTGLGLVGQVLRNDDPDVAPTRDDTRTGQTIPQLTDKPVENDPKPDVADPSLAFQMTDLRYEGGNLIVAWQDPSDGEAFFHISQTKPEEAYLQAFPVGQTEAEFPYQLALGRPCFVIVLHMPDESLGLSNQRCLRNAGG